MTDHNSAQLTNYFLLYSNTDDPNWEALKERLWNHYETRGYQGERFIYDTDFHTALDQARLAWLSWTPVSTALPSPECVVLAFYRNSLGKGRIVVAQWVPANTVQDSCDEDFAVYNEELDQFFWPEGWYECVDNWDELSALKIYEGQVTHWMPLPEAPQP